MTGMSSQWVATENTTFETAAKLAAEAAVKAQTLLKEMQELMTNYPHLRLPLVSGVIHLTLPQSQKTEFPEGSQPPTSSAQDRWKPKPPIAKMTTPVPAVAVVGKPQGKQKPTHKFQPKRMATAARTTTAAGDSTLKRITDFIRGRPHQTARAVEVVKATGINDAVVRETLKRYLGRDFQRVSKGEYRYTGGGQ